MQPPRRGPVGAPEIELGAVQTALTQTDTHEPCRYGVDSIALDELTTASIKPGRYILVGARFGGCPRPCRQSPLSGYAGGDAARCRARDLITYGDRYVHDPGPLIGYLDKAGPADICWRVCCCPFPRSSTPGSGGGELGSPGWAAVNRRRGAVGPGGSSVADGDLAALRYRHRAAAVADGAQDVRQRRELRPLGRCS